MASLFRQTENNKGFTAVNLAVGLAITAVLSTSAALKISSLLANRDILREKERVLDALETAILLAWDREDNLDFVILGRDYKITQQKTGRSILLRRLKPSLTITSSRNPIHFYKSGVVSPATILISSKSRSCAITVSLRGRVKASC